MTSPSEPNCRDIPLSMVFYEVDDRELILDVLRDLDMHTVEDVITKFKKDNFRQSEDWAAVENRLKPAPRRKVEMMIESYQAGKEQFDQWVQPRMKEFKKIQVKKTKLGRIFFRVVDQKNIVDPLADLSIFTVSDVISKHDNQEDWRSVEEKLDSISRSWLIKLDPMIKQAEAGDDALVAWVQERIESAQVYEAEQIAKNRQHYHLTEILGLDTFFAKVIESRFDTRRISEFSGLSNQIIFHKLSDPVLQDRIYLIFDFCHVCADSREATLHDLYETIWKIPQFVLDTKTKKVFMQELQMHIYYLSRLKERFAFMPTDEQVELAGAALPEEQMFCMYETNPNFEDFIKLFGFKSDVGQAMITEMKKQMVENYIDLDQILWWDYPVNLQDPVRHVSTIYSMCKHASLDTLPSLCVQSTNAIRFFTSEEKAYLWDLIGYKQERLLALQNYMRHGFQYSGTKRKFGHM